MQDQRVLHWGNSSQFLGVGIVGYFELVGEANGHDVVVDPLANQEFVVEGSTPDGDFEHRVPKTPRSTLPAAEADTFH